MIRLSYYRIPKVEVLLIHFIKYNLEIRIQSNTLRIYSFTTPKVTHYTLSELFTLLQDYNVNPLAYDYIEQFLFKNM